MPILQYIYEIFFNGADAKFFAKKSLNIGFAL